MSSLYDDYQSSTKTEENLKFLLNRDELKVFEYVYTFYMKEVYFILIDRVLGEFHQLADDSQFETT